STPASSASGAAPARPRPASRPRRGTRAPGACAGGQSRRPQRTCAGRPAGRARRRHSRGPEGGPPEGRARRRGGSTDDPRTASGGTVNLAEAAPRLVLYVYPSATGTPDLPAPDWKEIPGAFGCTAESCAFRDRKGSFEALGVTVIGLSAQTTDAQRAFAGRKEINFPLLSDPDLKLSAELGL